MAGHSIARMSLNVFSGVPENAVLETCEGPFSKDIGGRITPPPSAVLYSPCFRASTPPGRSGVSGWVGKKGLGKDSKETMARLNFVPSRAKGRPATADKEQVRA